MLNLTQVSITSGSTARNHRFLKRKPLVSKRETDGFSKGNRWKPPNKLTETASKDDGNRQRRQRFAVLPMLMNISG